MTASLLSVLPYYTLIFLIFLFLPLSISVFWKSVNQQLFHRDKGIPLGLKLVNNLQGCF